MSMFVVKSIVIQINGQVYGSIKTAWDQYHVRFYILLLNHINKFSAGH